MTFVSRLSPINLLSYTLFYIVLTNPPFVVFLGMFLQIWPTSSPSQDRSIEIEGQIIFVPYGKILIVPASTIHGGGFRTTVLEEKGGYSKSTSSSGGGNLRFHLYIATNQTSLPAHQTNKYTEPCDKTKELSRRYVDSEHMQVLLENLFV